MKNTPAETAKTKESRSSNASLWSIFASFFRIGILTFGGGYAMLPMFERECVERHGWVDENELLDLYAISQCTPGIIATNASTYIGRKMRGIPGAVAATCGVITPSLIIICIVAAFLRKIIEYPVVQHAFGGIRIAVCALLITTTITMLKKGIRDALGVVIFIAAFALAFFTDIPLILLIIGTGLIGWVWYTVKARRFPPEKTGSGSSGACEEGGSK